MKRYMDAKQKIQDKHQGVPIEALIALAASPNRVLSTLPQAS